MGIFIGLVIYLSLNMLLGLCFGYFSMTSSFIFYLAVAVVGAGFTLLAALVSVWQQSLTMLLCAILFRFMAVGLILNWVVYSGYQNQIARATRGKGEV